ncbi:MAG TPA: serpin family protein [Verrucomicrobiales bacterium]|nr:serpin family protein [Verrucomicrobiales bacterium]
MSRAPIISFLVALCFAPLCARAQNTESPSAAASAVNHLAACLGKPLLSKSGNPLFSPWSAQSVLAMAWTGAAGDTEKEMRSVLGFTGDAAAVSRSFHSLHAALTIPRPGEKPAVVRAASRLFVEDGYPLLPAWTDGLKNNFGAGAEPVPFAARSLEAFARINLWVKENTAGKITDLFPPETSSALTRMVLADAVYFNVPWQTPFKRRLTRLETFFLTKGNTRKTSFMHTERNLSYARKAGFQIVALDYGARDLQFVAMIPDKQEGLPAVVAGLTPELLKSCAGMDSQLVSLAIPRLNLRPPAVSLGEPLRALGLVKAQSPLVADFTGISQQTPRLFISRVRQSAWLVMDEKGTEAAAATGADVPFGAAPAPPKPIIVRADRPFLFLIQHVPSAACLFVGCVNDPGMGGMTAGG